MTFYYYNITSYATVIYHLNGKGPNDIKVITEHSVASSATANEWDFKNLSVVILRPFNQSSIHRYLPLLFFQQVIPFPGFVFSWMEGS